MYFTLFYIRYGDRQPPCIYQYMSFFISLHYTSTWGSTIPTPLSMYFILDFVAVHKYVGIDDPHVFINIFYSLFCYTTYVGIVDPHVFINTYRYLFSRNTSTWGSTIPTYHGVRVLCAVSRVVSAHRVCARGLYAVSREVPVYRAQCARPTRHAPYTRTPRERPRVRRVYVSHARSLA